ETLSMKCLRVKSLPGVHLRETLHVYGLYPRRTECSACAAAGCGKIRLQTRGEPMPCEVEVLRNVPLFGLLDEDELTVLASQVELKKFAPRQRIYKTGETTGRAYVMVSGAVRVTTTDEDHQEVLVDQPASGEFFGFASMLDGTPHQTDAVALEQTVCLEIDQHDIDTLVHQKPHAALDMLSVIGRQFHATQQLIRVRAARNPNEIIEA